MLTSYVASCLLKRCHIFSFSLTEAFADGLWTKSLVLKVMSIALPLRIQSLSLGLDLECPVLVFDSWGLDCSLFCHWNKWLKYNYLWTQERAAASSRWNRERRDELEVCADCNPGETTSEFRSTVCRGTVTAEVCVHYTSVREIMYNTLRMLVEHHDNVEFLKYFIEFCGNISVKLWVCWVLCLPLTKIAMFLL